MSPDLATIRACVRKTIRRHGWVLDIDDVTSRSAIALMRAQRAGRAPDLEHLVRCCAIDEIRHVDRGHVYGPRVQAEPPPELLPDLRRDVAALSRADARALLSGAGAGRPNLRRPALLQRFWGEVTA